MTNKLLYVTLVLLYFCAPVEAASKKKDALLSAPSSLTKQNDVSASNDSNTYLYDLMVDLITINGEKVTPSSKASKPPSRNPTATQVPSVVLVDKGDDDDDNFLDDNFLDDNPVRTTSTNAPSSVQTVSPSLDARPIPSDSTMTSVPTSNTSSASTTAPTLNSTTESSSSLPSPMPVLATSVASASNSSDVVLKPSRAPIGLHSSSPIKSKASKSPATIDIAIIECPQQFNSSAKYQQFDVVSMESIIYKCKPWPNDAYCNSFEPGSKYSDHGWTIEGPCVTFSPSPSPTVETSAEPSLSPSSSIPTDSPTADQDITHSPTAVSVESVTVFPTPVPTTNSSAVASQAPSKGNDVLSVDLPRIICDISLSPHLAPKFQQKHVLLVAMTNTLFNILDVHLSNDVAGISLSVQVAINSNGNETSATMMRLKADFTGSVSFSLDDDRVPAESDLVNILLSHFSIEEFTKRLTSPLKTTRASIQDSVVKVNSVFFFEDGMLLPAGANHYSASSSPTSEEATLETANNIQVAVGVFVLTAVGFALVMILFVAHSKRIDFEYEDETVLPDAAPTSNKANAVATPQKKENSDAEIQVKTRKRNPYFGGIDSLSDLSSLSESPYTDRLTSSQDIAPTAPSLGIAAPSYRYFAGTRTPYVDDASMGDDKEWRMRSHMLETP